MHLTVRPSKGLPVVHVNTPRVMFVLIGAVDTVSSATALDLDERI